MFFKKKIVISDLVMNQFHSLDSIHSIKELVICYSVIASQDKKTVIHASHLIFEYLQGKTLPQLISISERSKQCTPFDYNVDWKNVNIHAIKDLFADSQIYYYLLILGSYHPNGFYREKCLIDLTNYDNTLPFILLRLNDWVDIIRNCSYKYSLNKISTCSVDELLSSLYALDKVQKSQRRNTTHFNTVKKELLDHIAIHLDSSFIPTILALDFISRKSVYKFILPSNILNYEDYNTCLAYEKNSFCQLLIIKSILHNDYLNDDQLSYYLNHKSSYIRKQALCYKYQRVQNYWNGLELFLLDSCFSIRDYTRFILKKHTCFDILEFYKKSLDHKNAIYGIGECGNLEDSKCIIPYLSQDNPAYVCAVIHSLSHLLKDSGKEIYYKYLFSPIHSISKQSFLAIKHNKIKYGATLIYNHYITNNNQHQKSYLFKLLLNENAWDRLPYLLILYSSHIQYRNLISSAIEDRNLYHVLSKKEADNIKYILTDKRHDIPQSIIDSILFDLKFITNKN